VITEVAGPLRVTDGQVSVEGSWRLLETSVRTSPAGFERISLSAEEPNLTITGSTAAPVTLASRSLEAHLRPNPARVQAEGAYDAALSARQARLPLVDAFVGGTEPADIQIDVTATQVQGFRGRPVLTEVERWRQASGRLEVLRLAASKGDRRFEAKGELALDELHRPMGQIQAAAAGLEGLIDTLTGSQGGGKLLSALLGQGPRPATPGAGGPALAPLPPVRLDNGRVVLGPFAIPNLRLPSLY
jgi:hypothetical protein